MPLIHKILHPTDFSHNAEGAFQMASALARDYKARLFLLHVMLPPTAPLLVEQSDNTPEGLKKRFPWPKAADPQLNVEYRIAEGDFAEEIIRFAQTANCDLIVMGTEGRSGLNRFLTGSVAESVIRKAACPVLTVKTPPATPVPHAQPGEVMNVRPLGANLSTTKTRALVKARDVEVIRMVVFAGKEIPTHQAKGEMIVQCLEGRIEFTSLGKSQTLEAGHMLYLPSKEPHSLKGIEDGSLLLTILLPK